MPVGSRTCLPVCLKLMLKSSVRALKMELPRLWWTGLAGAVATSWAATCQAEGDHLKGSKADRRKARIFPSSLRRHVDAIMQTMLTPKLLEGLNTWIPHL